MNELLSLTIRVRNLSHGKSLFERTSGVTETNCLLYEEKDSYLILILINIYIHLIF